MEKSPLYNNNYSKYLSHKLTRLCRLPRMTNTSSRISDDDISQYTSSTCCTIGNVYIIRKYEPWPQSLNSCRYNYNCDTCRTQCFFCSKWICTRESTTFSTRTRDKAWKEMGVTHKKNTLPPRYLSLRDTARNNCCQSLAWLGRWTQYSTMD